MGAEEVFNQDHTVGNARIAIDERGKVYVIGWSVNAAALVFAEHG